MNLCWNLEYSGAYVVGLQADAIFHSFTNVESVISYQGILANAIVGSWPTFLHNLSSFLTALGCAFVEKLL